MLAPGGLMSIVIQPGDWETPREVMVTGLDDWFDDYNTTFTVVVTFTSEDPLYQTSDLAALAADRQAANVAKTSPTDSIGTGVSNGYLAAFVVPFTNVDDDDIGLVAEIVSVTGGHCASIGRTGVCSESYYGCVATLLVYTTSQPKETLLLTVTSSNPTEAGPIESIVVITSEDWRTPKEVHVESYDDPLQDGDIPFNVTVATLYSPDEDYGQSENKYGTHGLLKATVPFISKDDPTWFDTVGTKCPKGYFGSYTGKDEGDFYGCRRCPAGTYADEENDKVDCRSCPPGTYGLVEGAQSLQSITSWNGIAEDPGCMPCPNGTYSATWG